MLQYVPLYHHATRLRVHRNQPQPITGKGMHSRLYTRVLNRHTWVHTCSAVNSLYNNTGLVGIFASGESSHAEQLISVMIEEMQVRASVMMMLAVASTVYARRWQRL